MSARGYRRRGLLASLWGLWAALAPGIAAAGQDTGAAAGAAAPGASTAPLEWPSALFPMLRNGDFAEPPPAARDAEGRRRIPWWESARGAEQLVLEEGASPALRTGPDEWARQPVPAWTPRAAGLVLRGEVAGEGRMTLRDGAGATSLAVGTAGGGFTRFELAGRDFAAAAGRDLQPRLELVLDAAGGGTARWRALELLVPLPAPSAEEMRAEVLAELERGFELFLERGLDREGARETAFLTRPWDVVTGEPLGTIEGGHSPFFELLARALAAHEHPRWRAALERHLEDLLELALHPGTGLPRGWDGAADAPIDDRFVELARPLAFLLDVSEYGPEAYRDRAHAAARRIGETVLASGIAPDGSIAPRYRSSDGAPNRQAPHLRALDLPAQLARLFAGSGEERALLALREAVATFEYTHVWPGTWLEIDPGFDDDYGHFGARAATMWRAFPEEAMFRRIALGGFRHYAPLWRDALRLGGNVAADQVRCWRIALEVGELAGFAGEEARELDELLRDAAHAHFQGEQYGNGAFGDVTVFGFDPHEDLQVGDFTGVPQNLLEGLALLHGHARGEWRDELRARFATVLATTRESYGRPFGHLSTRRELAGANGPRGTLSLLVGLVAFLERP